MPLKVFDASFSQDCKASKGRTGTPGSYQNSLQHKICALLLGSHRMCGHWQETGQSMPLTMKPILSGVEAVVFSANTLN